MRWKLASLFIILLLAFPLSGGAVQKRLSVPVGDSPTLGASDAPVTIIEFMDFQ